MVLNIDVNFEGKLTFAFKNDIRNLGKFLPEHLVSQNLDFGILLNPKWKMHELKIYRGTICHDNEKAAKLEEELTRCFKVEMRILMNFNPSTRKSKKFAL